MKLSRILNRRAAAASATFASLVVGSIACAAVTGPYQPTGPNALAAPSEIVFPDANGNLSPPSSANPIATQSSGNTNTDASANAPSLSGLNLLGTLAANPLRRGFIVQVQDTATDCSGSGGLANGLPVVLDDGGSSLTVLVLAYATVKGGQGGSISWSGIPHTGRIRYYGTAGCQIGAAQW